MPYQSGTNTLYSKHKYNMMCITVDTLVQFDDEKVLEQISTHLGFSIGSKGELSLISKLYYTRE